MVTQVSFGSFYQLNGKTVEAGAGGSGIDTQSLITTLVTAKSAPATQDQDQITINNAQGSALSTFQQLLSTFQSAADALSNPPGVDNAANNVFQFTTGSVSSNGSGYISVTTAPGAALQSYAINNITQLASAATQSTGVFTVASADATAVSASPIAGTAVQLAPGTITINGQAITLDEGDSLNTVAAKFNAVSTNSGVTASVIQVASGQFQLQFTATSTGTNDNFDLTSTAIDPGNAVFGGASLGAATAGTDAKFKINGIAIDRQSNNISDVISGVTFDLLQTTSSDPTSNANISVSVQPDTTTVQNAIVSFVNAYNAIQTFATQQTQLNSSGTYASSAVLADNQTFRSLMTDLNTEVVSQVSGLAAGQPNSLAEAGITLTTQPASGTTPQVPNILTVNDGQLSSELSTNFSGIANLFGFNLTSDNSNLAVFSQTNALSATQFTLNLDPGSSTFTATVGGGAPITLTATALPGGGYSLAGPDGSPLAGLVLIYGSNSPATINVTATQGIGSQLNNTTNAALTASTGTIPVEQQSLQANNTSLNSDITQINLQVAQYQQELVSQFAALEQAVTNVNALLSSLNANSVAAQEAANLP